MVMFDPPHPGMMIADQMGKLSVTAVAKHLRMSRAALSHLLSGNTALSAEIALRLQDAFGIRAGFWLGMQASRDLWLAQQKKRAKLEPLELHQASLPAGSLAPATALD